MYKDNHFILVEWLAYAVNSYDLIHHCYCLNRNVKNIDARGIRSLVASCAILANTYALVKPKFVLRDR